MRAGTSILRPPVVRWILAVALTLILLVGAGGIASADETTTTVVAAETTAEEAAPALDYTFTWPTFILTFALVIGYYVFVLRMSEKEFKGVVVERFGPRAADQGEGT